MPTDEERAKYDKIASFVFLGGTSAAFTPLDSQVGVWARGALAKTFAKDGAPADIVRIRMMGGTVPTEALRVTWSCPTSANVPVLAAVWPSLTATAAMVAANCGGRLLTLTVTVLPAA